MTDPAAAAVGARLHAAFERVHRERMTGLPFVNDALRVEAVGLRRWRGLWIGVLLTPWCMNLMLLPGAGAAGDDDEAVPWPRLVTGEYARFAFPAGEMSFLGGREAEAGDYLSCSLFSPMFEFADHETARQTAAACLMALFDPAAAADPPGEPRADAAPAPVSKRDFLRGRWRAAAPPAGTT